MLNVWKKKLKINFFMEHLLYRSPFFKHKHIVTIKNNWQKVTIRYAPLKNTHIWASQLPAGCRFCCSSSHKLLNLILFNGCIPPHSWCFLPLLDAVLNWVWRSVNVSIMLCLWGDGNGFLGTWAFADVRKGKLRPPIKDYCKSMVRLYIAD